MLAGQQLQQLWQDMADCGQPHHPHVSAQIPHEGSAEDVTSGSRTGAERGDWHAPLGRPGEKGLSAQRGAVDALGGQAAMQAARRWGHSAVGVCGLELHLHISVRVQCMLIAQHG